MKSSGQVEASRGALWTPLIEGFKQPQAQVLILACIVLVFEWHHRSFGLLPHRLWTFEWFLVSFVCFFVVPVVFWRLHPVLRGLDCGLAAGDVRWWSKVVLVLYALTLPVLILAAQRPEFQDFYPLWAGARMGGWPLLYYELAYIAYFFAWEFLFRGFLLQSLRTELGTLAIFVQLLPFVLAHFTKPEPEVWGALFAGLVLGALAWRARSFWPAFLLHALCAVTFDVLCVAFH